MLIQAAKPELRMVYSDMAEKFSLLDVGGSVSLSADTEKGVYMVAKRLGIKVVVRSLGSDENITVYRVE